MSTKPNDWTALAVTSVLLERDRQDVKWGANRNHAPADWMLILGEEYGEACEAALDMIVPSNDGREASTQFRAELVQIAAVAVAMIECLDRQSAATAQHKGEA